MSATVVALGGNALMRPGERGTAAEQLANLRRAVTALRPLLAQPGVVLTHGNGPQVGNELIRQERRELGPTPAEVGAQLTQAPHHRRGRLARTVMRPTTLIDEDGDRPGRGLPA